VGSDHQQARAFWAAQLQGQTVPDPMQAAQETQGTELPYTPHQWMIEDCHWRGG